MLDFTSDFGIEFKNNLMFNKFIVFVFGLLFFTSCSPLLFDKTHTSDEILLKTFRENRADFELLARMAKQNSNMVRIADNFTWTKDSAAFPRPESELGITNERWEEYKRLFRKLGLTNGILNYQPDKIYFTASSQGLLTGGSSKGYAFLREEPALLSDSLDNYDFNNSKKETNFVFRRLEGNWYLYYEVNG